MKYFLQRQRGAAIAAQSHDDLSRGGLAQPGLLEPGGPTAGPAHGRARRGSLRHGLMVIRFSTRETPGTCQATRSASWRSAQDRTEPRSVTAPPSVSTVMRLASTSALRRKDSSILRRTSTGGTRGLTYRYGRISLPRTRGGDTPAGMPPSADANRACRLSPRAN